MPNTRLNSVIGRVAAIRNACACASILGSTGGAGGAAEEPQKVERTQVG